MRRVIITLIVLAMATSALAATVTGQVTRPDGSPYGSASVTLKSGDRSATVYTGSNGVFAIENVPAGEYVIEVKGRTTKTVNVTVTSAPVAQVPTVRID